ncbi:MAG: P-II family nitrogen regulator [Desulfomonilaceae bacterium]
MYSIEVTVKPFKLNDVREALADLGVGGMTVTETLRQVTPKRPIQRFSDLENRSYEFVPYVHVQVVVSDWLVESVVEALCLHGSSGKLDDSSISVSPVESVVRIRTGDRNDDALST